MKTKIKKITKKDKLIKRLPEYISGKKSLKQLATEVGYTEGSRNMYRNHIKSQLTELLEINPDEIRKRFAYIYKLALAKEDYSNANRSAEALARINAMFTDKSEVTTKEKLNPNEITDKEHKLKLRKELEQALDMLVKEQ